MGLQRVWMPSPNKSSRGGSGVRLIVVHTSEGAQDFTSLGNYFKSSSVQASSQVGCDNSSRGKIGEYVSRGDKAWTQANANPYCTSNELCTPSGAAQGWSDGTWRSKDTMLRNCADWIAEEAKYFGIPITKLSASQAQGGSKGVCGHGDLGSAGGGHTDPGPNFPWSYVLDLARGANPSSPPASSGGKPALHVDYFGKSHNSTCGDVRVWQDKMASWGWFTASQVDGIFGGQSESVAKRFQAQQGLTQDGLVGQGTWNKTFP
jgi:peptidoglycan hydrolase-like protein with peptidoglycan-binding domain